ncbi:hypothetical protein L6452_28149 [Arctium lappa]|uniref:Uncharacterized protein n=1 Tax=Arctium lappa TaxID=4217 RepID=A0ACB8ZXG4_ARCLA|nr:hypothetical protein L6452_28149 [Arctium lappa]
MDLESAKVSSPVKNSDVQAGAAVDTGHDPAQDSPSRLSASGITTWAKSLKLPQPLGGTQDESSSENAGKSSFARLTSGLGLRLSPKAPQQDDSPDGAPTTPQAGIFGTITKGFVDTSKNAVKAVQVKARHVVSQNKRRYTEGGFDLDMTYITENIIAMGFPAGDMSSGFFGYVEGFYRNHMEEVIRFFETYHKDKYKVYNLCSERLYDASLFEGKVASFPFDDHNCPPIRLIISFCQSAYSWLKEDIENVVVVHCKAGMARTGLMISSLLLYLKFFPTAEESISYYNQKRCVDGKGLVLPSQIRYVKYFERVMTYFNGEDQPGRRCMLRGFRLHRCPYWIRPSITVSDHNGVLFSTKKHPRTKDLSPEDFWFSAPRKGIMVFALPGEPGLTELSGDFKIHFHDRQGDFYCWLNTTMIENRKVLTTNDLDGFDKRKLPSPGFQVEVVVVDYDNAAQAKPETESNAKPAVGTSANPPETTPSEATTTTNSPKDSRNSEKDDEVFSDTESEAKTDTVSETNSVSGKMASLSNDTKNISIGNSGSSQISLASESKNNEVVSQNPIGEVSDFKAMAADTSVFTFGDDEDYESD